MSYLVYVLPQGGRSPLEGTPFMSSGVPGEDVWRRCAHAIALAGARDGDAAYEVHLVVPAVEPDRLFEPPRWMLDRDLLRQTLRLARRHGWGAPIYLGVQGSAVLSAHAARQLPELLRVGAEEGLDDILELAPGASTLTEAIRMGVTRSHERRRVARAACAEDAPLRWRCEVFARGLAPALFDPFRKTAEPCGLMLVVDSAPHPPKFYDLLIGSGRDRMILVVGETRRSGEDGGSSSERIVHGRPLEARYFLERLSRAHPAAFPPVRRGIVEEIPRWSSPVLPPWERDEAPQVVITNGFAPQNESELVRAAHGIGEVANELRSWADVHVDPVATPDRIRSRVGRLDRVSAWIHVGPAAEVTGEATAGACTAAWCGAFAGTPVLAAIVAADDSCTAAKAFVGAGATMAVGFRGYGTIEQRCELARRVASAAVREGTETAVLNAFHSAVTGMSHTGAIAYRGT